MDNTQNPASPAYQLAVNPGPIAPNAWQFRAPVACTTGNNTISWTVSQATFDAEIQAANSFGLDFWAFDRYYPNAVNNQTMNIAFNYYLSTTMQTKPRYAILLQLGYMGTTGNYSSQVADTVAAMGYPNYMFVKGNRPLVYLLFNSTIFASNWGSSYSNVAAMVSALRTAVQNAGMANPYLACLTGGSAAATGIGADCYGRYTGAIPIGTNTPFATMDSNVRAGWASDAAAFSPFIPTCNVGFDPTPLNNLPPTWWTTNTNTVIEPTNAELIAHLQAGADYVRANPTICDSGTVLVYAWSECAEGGVAMMPTVGNPTGTKGRALLSVN